MKPKKDRAVKLAMGDNLDDTIGPPEKRKKLGEMRDDSHMSDDARSGMETRYACGMKARHAAEIAIRDRNRLKAELDVDRGTSSAAADKLEEPADVDRLPKNNRIKTVKLAHLRVDRSITINASGRVEELTAGEASQRGEAPIPVKKNKRKESVCVQKNAQDDAKKSDRVTATKARNRKFESQLNEGTQKGEKVRLQSDVDAAPIVKRAWRNKRPIKPTEEEEMKVTTSAGTPFQKTQVTLQRNSAKLQVERTFTALQCQKRKMEQDLVAMERDAEDRRKLQEAHQRELDTAQGEFERMTSMSLHDIMQVVKKNNGLENELISVREEKDLLESSLEAVLQYLEEEKEKRLCQICLEMPKETICFPCLHLNFCFVCLEKHREQNNSCPSCRTAITGVLRCDLCI